MKLYATVTSERATKGQGGRNLVIDITGENGLKLWTIEVNPTGLNAKDYSLLVQRTKYNPLYCFDDRLNEKGEKQKGETMKYFCTECGHIESWSAKLYSEKGEPVCPNDDNDMTLQ